MLRLENGQVIEVIGRPAQGTRHLVLFGHERRAGARVVVKFEMVAGALEPERRSLAWLSSRGAPVAALRAASRTRLADGRDARCLVIDHAPGRFPAGGDGWARMGRALAALTSVPYRGAGLAIQDHEAFGRAHAARVRDLADELGGAVAAVEDWNRLRSARVPSHSPLVITHGDPGPGNFLDDGHAGTLIDWEEAHVAPRGLDLARAIFIARLGVGPEGYVAGDRCACARAVATGYRDGLGEAWASTREEQRWWLAVAGIQFAHRRWQRRGRPGVLAPGDAITVLAAALG